MNTQKEISQALEKVEEIKKQLLSLSANNVSNEVLADHLTVVARFHINELRAIVSNAAYNATHGGR